MDSKTIKMIQKEGCLDVGRLLTEDELREIAYLKTGSSCFTWGDILDYVSNNMLEYSIDFIIEVQGQYAKEYVAEHHTSKARGLAAARKNTQVSLAYIIRDELMKGSMKKNLELMKKLQKEGYLKFFE